MLKTITNSRNAMRTGHLVMLPLIVGLLLILILVVLRYAGYQNTVAQNIVAGLTFFLWGCTGLPMIIRKEIPWFTRAPGWVAVVQGVLLLIIGWTIALGFAILFFNSPP